LLSREGRPTTRGYKQLAHSLGNPPELESVLDDLCLLGLICDEHEASDQVVYSLSQHYLEKVIEMDPRIIDRKRAEEMLERGVREFRLTGSNLPEYNYRFVKRHLESGTFAIPSDAETLWRKSENASINRHLISRTLIAGLLGLALFVPASFFNIMGRQFGPSPPTDSERGIIYGIIILAGALLGMLVNGLGAFAITWQEYHYPHWPAWKQVGFIWLFLFFPFLGLGILGTLKGGSISSPVICILLGIMSSICVGSALYLSIPPRQSAGWWGYLRPAVTAGMGLGLLLAASLFVADLVSPSMNTYNRVVLWVELPSYVVTLTTSFAGGLVIGERMLLDI
jgi:hypothetical protein